MLHRLRDAVIYLAAFYADEEAQKEIIQSEVVQPFHMGPVLSLQKSITLCTLRLNVYMSEA